MSIKAKTITKPLHCYECFPQPTFHSHEERVEHLKTYHPKWWLEYSCNDNKECKGFHDGTCGFNHFNIGIQDFNIRTEMVNDSKITKTIFEPSKKFYIDNTTAVPDEICPNDRPWENVRCSLTVCEKDHFWGRVRFLKKNSRKAPVRELDDTDIEALDNLILRFNFKYNTMKDSLKKLEKAIDEKNHTDIIKYLIDFTEYQLDFETLYVSSERQIDSVRRIKDLTIRQSKMEGFDDFDTDLRKLYTRFNEIKCALI